MKELAIILIAFLFFCCSENKSNVDKVTQQTNLPSKQINSDFWDAIKTDPSDTLAYYYLSNINYSNCQSIRETLTSLYNIDQQYRDSSQIYRRKGNHDEKVKSFGDKFKQVDRATAKVMYAIIDSLIVKKSCLVSQVEFDAIWIVAHHSNERELIRKVYPLVKFGFDNSFIQEDAYRLYYNNIINMNINDLSY